MKKKTISLSFLLGTALLIDTQSVYADNLTNLQDKKKHIASRSQ